MMTFVPCRHPFPATPPGPPTDRPVPHTCSPRLRSAFPVYAAPHSSLPRFPASPHPRSSPLCLACSALQLPHRPSYDTAVRVPPFSHTRVRTAIPTPVSLSPLSTGASEMCSSPCTVGLHPSLATARAQPHLPQAIMRIANHTVSSPHPSLVFTFWRLSTMPRKQYKQNFANQSFTPMLAS